jgi:hypothetical protein
MRKHYLPNDDSGRLTWLINFNSKIGTYSRLFGISAAEVTAIGTYLVMLQYILDLIEKVRTFSQNLTKYKDDLMIAPLGTTLGDVPTLTIDAPPPVTPAGIFTIISGIVQRIKGNAACTESIGEDLGIVGADIIIDYAALKPVLKITMDVNNPKIKYPIKRTDGINLYADHDDGQGMKFMRFISKATFVDATVLQPAQNSAVFKYIGIYVVDDLEVGIPGDETVITVKKKV